jgi:hypothetical protein
MDTSTPDLQSLAARIEKLERQNRLLRGAGLALLLLPVALVAMGQARPTRTVEAEEFVLRDSSGTKRAALQLTRTEPFEIPEAVPPLKVPAGVSANLTLYGEKGEIRAVLGAAPLASALAFYGYDGNPHVTIGNLGGETPTLNMRSGDNKAEVTVDRNGPQFDLMDNDGFSLKLGSTALVTGRTGEQHKTSAASLTMFGKDGKVLWSAP